MGAKGLGTGGFELRWSLEVIWFSTPSSPITKGEMRLGWRGKGEGHYPRSHRARRELGGRYRAKIDLNRMTETGKRERLDLGRRANVERQRVFLNPLP